jgi:serine-type D-Ala-D-Ala carboxypeptidase/endopeptidase (penicillin-binding protein 4)
MKYLFILLFPMLLWADLDHALVSAYAINCKTGQVIMNVDAEKSLVPASCMKVVTTGAALHLLKPDSRFQTDLEIDGALVEGVLQGNVRIIGGGDPCLGSDRTKESLAWEKQIEVWADALANHGIKAITGEIIGDASRWETAGAAPSWAFEDIANYYGAGATALTFHENMYTLTFKPGPHEGAPAILHRVIPAASNFVLSSEVKTGPVGSGDRACIFGAEYLMTHVVRGTIPAGVEEFSIKGAIPDPAKLCSELLTKALEKRGIQVLGRRTLPAQIKQVIHTTPSPLLTEIVYWTNQKSINLYAEHLLKSMGGGTTAAGIKAVTEFWKGQGITTEGMNMADGSGLSRKNFITAKHLASMLQKMKESPYFSEFYASLPEEYPGVRAKDGAMSFIRCLAGYKGDIVFAIMINQGQDSKAMKQKLEQILDQML